MGEYAMPTTGDAAEDEKHMQRFILSQERLDRNECPNGCGQLNVVDAQERECPKCKFSHFVVGGGFSTSGMASA